MNREPGVTPFSDSAMRLPLRATALALRIQALAALLAQGDTAHSAIREALAEGGVPGTR